MLRRFSDLLSAAKSQTEPQRLLMVFAAVELPSNASPAQRAGFERGEGGVLTPKLCVDKSPQEITDFAALCSESADTGVVWDIMFVGAMLGRAGHPPSADEAAQPLQFMVEAIRSGRLSRFLAIDREGDLIQLRPG